MLFAILAIGILFLGLILKLAAGVIRIVLIVVVLAIIAVTSMATHNSDTTPPAEVQNL